MDSEDLSCTFMIGLAIRIEKRTDVVLYWRFGGNSRGGWYGRGFAWCWACAVRDQQ
ncbi:hypothetical protein TRAPUB_5949 [Trametes pubescens]|uniref:Uncharacterized protein n=1 Tax=Trametes pubescens TaxID=154538 RepID=A0A1M2W6Y9_TRAPU|nr:hypothetical protein TRAPUB_5949 [Trametes pubescens]